MRIVYEPETVQTWQNALQSGAGIFAGVPYQRGSGLGSIFRGLFRFLWPAVKNIGKSAGREALQAGAEIASDVLKGENIKRSAKRRGKQALGRTIRKVTNQQGSGIGMRNHGRCLKRIQTHRTPSVRKRFKTDIFHGKAR